MFETNPQGNMHLAYFVFARRPINKMAPSLFTSILRCFNRNQRLCSWTLACAVFVTIVWHLTSFRGTLMSKYSGKLVWHRELYDQHPAAIHVIHAKSDIRDMHQDIGLFGSPKCILLNVDPFNSAVTNRLKKFGRLECRGSPPYSSLSGNVLTVKGNGLHEITYSAITDSSDPLKVPFIVGETKLLSKAVPVLRSGKKNGGIAHYLGKCFHPHGKAKEGTELILHSSCQEARLRFQMEDDGTMKHIQSGLCVVPEHSSLKPDTKLVLGRDCSIAKYRGLQNGFVQHQASGLCIHFQSSYSTPPNGAIVILYNDCKQNMKMRFSWKDSFKRDKDTDVNLSVKMDNEFVEVILISPSTPSGKQDNEYALQIPPKLNIQEPKYSPQTKLNILMVMFHSTSTAHFKRKMPKSYAFLSNVLETVFVPGFSTIDESTKSQLAALLAGVSPQKMNSTPVDSLPWLFKIAKDNGYVTLMSEDKPYSAVHSDTLTGFQSSRPDHYAAPFWAAVHRTYTPGSNSFCIGDKPMHNISLSYVQDFFTVYSRLSKFALLMNTEVSSWNINSLSYVDEDFHQFLGWMKQEGHLKNTMLVVFSDHGSRSHSIRETLQGKIEERMPYLSISLPSEAPKDLVTKFSNLAENAKGLVSPYDVYKTLSNVLTFPKFADHSDSPGQNLLDKSDHSDRTCDQLKIPSHWCPCVDVEKVSISDSHVKAAEGVVEMMNRRLQMSKSSCTDLKFAKLRSVAKLMPNSDVLRFRISRNSAKCIDCKPMFNQAYTYQDFFYVLYIEVLPGQKVYRAIVNLVESGVFVHPDIVLVEGQHDSCTVE